ncbi:MAG: serine hydrolase [Bdellovibrionales bacterium]|nr:serine hydrolase [Bdellovibrionales bacterium]
MKILASFFLLALTACHPFPEDAWETTTPKKAGFDEAAFANYLTFMKDPGNGSETHALVVVKDGKIVTEWYAKDIDPAHRHTLWSASKSVSHAIVGAAWDVGHFKLTDAVTLPGAPPGLTVSDLLQMSSGIFWREDYVDPMKSTIIPMLYTRASHADLSSWVLSMGQEYTPGEFFRYSSGDTNVLMKWVRDQLPAAERDDFPWKKVFEPIGIRSATFEADAQGNWLGSSYLYMTPRDFARFGLLYARGGRWKNQQILSRDWLKTTLRDLAPSLKRKGAEKRSYANQWHLNLPYADGSGRPYNDWPEDTILAFGHRGQYLLVVPSLDLVVARVGADRSYFDDEKGLALLSQSLKGAKTVHPPLIATSVYASRAARMPTGTGLTTAPTMEELLSYFYAKELCSCLFVEEMPEAMCLRIQSQPWPASQVDVRHASREVAVSVGPLTLTSTWVSDHLGCSQTQ